MKKNILIIVLILISAFLYVTGFIKGSEVEKYSIELNLVKQESEKLRDEAVSLQEIALNEAAKARMAEAHAVDLAEQLRQCQSK